MAPFRNPFKEAKEAMKQDRGPSGMQTLIDTVKKGTDKAKEKGIQSVLADVRDGISQRNYGRDDSFSFFFVHTHELC